VIEPRGDLLVDCIAVFHSQHTRDAIDHAEAGEPRTEHLAHALVDHRGHLPSGHRRRQSLRQVGNRRGSKGVTESELGDLRPLAGMPPAGR